MAPKLCRVSEAPVNSTASINATPTPASNGGQRRHDGHRRQMLAGWGAILAIPTAIFSLYGMNFEWMPELTWKFGDAMALAVTLMGCGCVHRRLRLSGWV